MAYRGIATLIAISAATVTVVACSSGGTPNKPAATISSPAASPTDTNITLSPSDVAAFASAAAGTATCASLLHESGWAKIVEQGAGCKDGDTIEATVTFRCTDGSSLNEFGEHPYYWGISTGPLHSIASKNMLDKSSEYSTAYQKCIGSS